MRHRCIQYFAKLFQFLLVTGCCAVGVVFFFDDGHHNQLPKLPTLMESTALAQETEIFSADSRQRFDDDLKMPSENQGAWRRSHFIPSGLKARWKTVTLDGSAMKLQVLDHPFSIASTHAQLGTEGFDYAADLFEQMAQAFQKKEASQALSSKLQDLSLYAQTLGNSVRQASRYRYEGVPSEDMLHLEIRGNILFHLKQLNPNALVHVIYNQDGRLLRMNQSPQSAVASENGAEVNALLSQMKQVLNHASAARYPETMNLVRKEAQLLSKMATHLTLRWDSTQYCQQSCTGTGMYVRMYARQSLPLDTLAIVPL